MGGGGLVTWLALPTVWWGPLNVDEELTLRICDFSFAHVFHIVSTKRGGGPLHFWLEHFLQGWWPGPSCAPHSVARLPVPRAAGGRPARPPPAWETKPAAASSLLTAASPIPVLYATFGRPHTLLFAWLMWSTVLALKAARRGNRRLWIAAGALLGLTVFIHPTAPLYALTAFGAALVYAPHRPRTVVRQAWPGAIALLVTFVPYYVRTLHVLGDRYGVGSGRSGRHSPGGRCGRTPSTSSRRVGTTSTTSPCWRGRRRVALARVGAYRTLAFCTLTVAAPVLFFSVVPGERRLRALLRSLHDPRHSGVSRRRPRRLPDDRRLGRRDAARRARLLVAGLARRSSCATTSTIATRCGGSASTRSSAPSSMTARIDPVRLDGTSGALFSSFDYGHPANILDHLVALRVPSVTLVDDDSCQRALPFVRGAAGPRYGVWLFYAASPAEARTAAQHARIGVDPVEQGRHYFVVRSRPRASRRAP